MSTTAQLSNWTAPSLVVEALRRGKRSGAFVHAICPICDPRGEKPYNPTLWASVEKWGCFRDSCQLKPEARGTDRAELPVVSAAEILRSAAQRKAHALRLLSSSRALRHDDIVDRYLRGRRILPLRAEWPEDLRFACLQHPETTNPVTKKGAPWPCMIAAVRNVDGEVIAAHRTYLDPAGVKIGPDGKPIPPGGKAPVREPKRSLGSITGASVWLGDVVDTMVVGEGIETTLAASYQIQEPGRSGLNSNGLAMMAIPRHVKRLWIANDRDEAGWKAYRLLVNRMRSERPDLWLGSVPVPHADANDHADLFF